MDRLARQEARWLVELERAVAHERERAVVRRRLAGTLLVLVGMWAVMAYLGVFGG